MWAKIKNFLTSVATFAAIVLLTWALLPVIRFVGIILTSMAFVSFICNCFSPKESAPATVEA